MTGRSAPSRRGWPAHPVASFLLFFAVFPFIVPHTSLATQVLTYGLIALGFNLLYGYTGLLSFGHAAYLGLGAYGSGLALAKLKIGSVWARAPDRGAGGDGGGALARVLRLRRRGIYFAMLTLAFAQMLYFIAFHAADLTGGDDGLRGIPLPALALPGVTLSLRTPLVFYYFAPVLVLPRRGRPRASSTRRSARASGHPREQRPRGGVRLRRDPDQLLCRALRGVHGARRRPRGPSAHRGAGEALYWSTSGQVVIMTLLGGAGTFFGPFVGALTFLVLEERLSRLIEWWPIVVGAVFMTFGAVPAQGDLGDADGPASWPSGA